MLAVTNVSSCQDITSSGTYNLVNDLTLDNPYCFENIVSNVIFDCNGFTIDGDNGNIFESSDDIDNLEIRNCNILNSDETFSFSGDFINSKFININVTNSDSRIFDIIFLNNNLIENVYVEANYVKFDLDNNNQIKNSVFFADDIDLILWNTNYIFNNSFQVDANTLKIDIEEDGNTMYKNVFNYTFSNFYFGGGISNFLSYNYQEGMVGNYWTDFTCYNSTVRGDYQVCTNPNNFSFDGRVDTAPIVFETLPEPTNSGGSSGGGGSGGGSSGSSGGSSNNLVNVTTCVNYNNDNINSIKEYTFNNDLNIEESGCLMFTGFNHRINCNGNTIYSNNNINGAIRFRDAENIEIKNCNFVSEGYSHVLDVDNSISILFENISIIGETSQNFWNSNNITFNNNFFDVQSLSFDNVDGIIFNNNYINTAGLSFDESNLNSYNNKMIVYGYSNWVADSSINSINDEFRGYKIIPVNSFFEFENSIFKNVRFVPGFELNSFKGFNLSVLDSELFFDDNFNFINISNTKLNLTDISFSDGALFNNVTIYDSKFPKIVNTESCQFNFNDFSYEDNNIELIDNTYSNSFNDLLESNLGNKIFCGVENTTFENFKIENNFSNYIVQVINTNNLTFSDFNVLMEKGFLFEHNNNLKLNNFEITNYGTALSFNDLNNSIISNGNIISFYDYSFQLSIIENTLFENISFHGWDYLETYFIGLSNVTFTNIKFPPKVDLKYEDIYNSKIKDNYFYNNTFNDLNFRIWTYNESKFHFNKTINGVNIGNYWDKPCYNYSNVGDYTYCTNPTQFNVYGNIYDYAPLIDLNQERTFDWFTGFKNFKNNLKVKLDFKKYFSNFVNLRDVTENNIYYSVRYMFNIFNNESINLVSDNEDYNITYDGKYFKYTNDKPSYQFNILNQTLMEEFTNSFDNKQVTQSSMMNYLSCKNKVDDYCFDLTDATLYYLINDSIREPIMKLNSLILINFSVTENQEFFVDSKRINLSLDLGTGVDKLFYQIDNRIVDISNKIENTSNINIRLPHYGRNDITFIAQGSNFLKVEKSVTIFANLTLNSLPNDIDGDSINDTEDRIKGDLSNINTELNITLELDNDINLSKVFNQTKNISIKKAGKPFIEFKKDFRNISNKLDLTEVAIVEEVKENKSQLLIYGIELDENETKTIYFSASNNSISKSLCLKNAEIFSFDEISVNCNSTDEIYVDDYTAGFDNGKIVVSYENESAGLLKVLGLEHSAISQICTENWQVGTFSTCSSSSQSRTVTDLNNCGTTINKPVETQSCTMPAGNTGGGSGGGGGGGGGSSTPVKVEEEVVKPVFEINLNSKLSSYDILVNGVSHKSSSNYSGTKKIKFKTGSGDTVFSFVHDFSEDLDLTKVNVETGSLSNFVIISGLSGIEKTVFLKSESSGSSVCVKDDKISSFKEFTKDCSGENEYIVSCSIDNVNSDYSCKYYNGYYEVTGSTHSGVFEIISDEVSEPVVSEDKVAQTGTGLSGFVEAETVTNEIKLDNGSNYLMYTIIFALAFILLIGLVFYFIRKE